MTKRKVDYSEYSKGIIEALVNEVMAKVYNETEFWPESWRQHFVMRMTEELNKQVAPEGIEMEL